MINCFDGEFAFLSNFYPSKIDDSYFDYPTVEHYFQAAKTLDLEKRAEIAAADTPGRAKRLGRKVKLRLDWEEIKDQVMLEALRKKFEIPALREKLLATGNKKLIEGNTWHDNTWGDCYCERCKDIKGQNRLGKILMQIREEIKSSI